VEAVRPAGVSAARRARARFGWAGLAVVTLVGTAALAAGCGGGSSGRGVASLGTTTVAAASSAGQSGSSSNPVASALGFVSCMRTHGEPNMPEPNIGKGGGHTSVDIKVSSGIDPSSPLFAAAYKACKHLLPESGAPSAGSTLGLADQKYYLAAAACMRSHGVSDFPDPTFQNGAVVFQSRTPIDTRSPQYERALTTCRKLIPAGLPYSSAGG
jgi:hypothetical protein